MASIDEDTISSQDMSCFKSSTMNKENRKGVQNLKKDLTNKKDDLTHKVNRKSLQTLKPSSINENVLVESKYKCESNDTIEKYISTSSSTILIPNCQKKVHSATKSKKKNVDVMDMLTSKEVPDDYWKEIAERRRVALEETLLENEQLHKTIEKLRAENERLTQLIKQVSQLTSFLEDSGIFTSDSNIDSP